jgi:hypothetical protein
LFNKVQHNCFTHSFKLTSFIAYSVNFFSNDHTRFLVGVNLFIIILWPYLAGCLLHMKLLFVRGVAGVFKRSVGWRKMCSWHEMTSWKTWNMSTKRAITNEKLISDLHIIIAFMMKKKSAAMVLRCSNKSFWFGFHLATL